MYILSFILFIILLLTLSILPSLESLLKNHFEGQLELNNAYIGSGLSVYTISIRIINKKELKNYKEIIKALSCLDYIHYIEELK